MGKDDIKDTDVFDAYKKMIGFQGVSMSDFATSGRVLIFGKVFDALCEGEPIEKGEDIEVVGSEGNKLIVKGIELEEEVEEIEEEVSSENLEVSETTEE